GGQGVGGAGSGGGPPVILSVDFVGGRPSATGAGGGAGAGGAMLIASPVLSPGEIAGFKPASRWNSAQGPAGSLSVLTLSNGDLTMATVTWNSPPGASGPGVWRLGYADVPGNARMMNGYLDPLLPSTPATIVVANLPTAIAEAAYDVYVYVSGDVQVAQMRTYRYAIGTTTFVVTETGTVPTAFPGFTLAPEGGAGNYVVFRNISGTSFTLTATPGSGSPSRAPVNGIQIVSPTGS
ncbi:MAG: hypothetical protein H7X95_06635, partial [Deltaproteobacteria bacterium]|nr:hypothetical protein [Deltaproteobacteria bacterium]